MFVYIFEDGSIGQHPEPPTQQDLEMISDGTLTVLECSYPKMIHKDDEASPLPNCQLNTEEGYHWI